MRVRAKLEQLLKEKNCSAGTFSLPKTSEAATDAAALLPPQHITNFAKKQVHLGWELESSLPHILQAFLLPAFAAAIVYGQGASDSMWLLRNYYQVLAFMFAIEEINRNPNMLPNISLGFHIYNAYHNDERTLESSLMWLSGQGQTIPNYSCERQRKSVVVIGGATSELTYCMGTLLELYKLPQISYGLFDPLISDPLQFPSVYQMAPSDTSLPLGMVRLMLHFKWNWVGLVASDDSRGEKFLRDLQEEMARNDVCVAFIKKITTNKSLEKNSYQYFVFSIGFSAANVIVIYGDTNSLLSLVFMENPDVLVRKVWITTSHWDIAKKPGYIYFDNFHGALIFSDQTNKIPGFKDFLKTVNPARHPEDIFLKNFWNSAFGCPHIHGKKDEEVCSPNASLDTLSLSSLENIMSDQSYTVYTAVYAVAWALHEMFLMRSEMEFNIDGDNRVVPPQKLHSFLKNLQFNNSAGKLVVLDKKRNSVANYDILNYVTFSNDTEVLIKPPQSRCNKVCGPGFQKKAQQGSPVCCFNCDPCPDRHISNHTDADQCVKCPEDQYPNQERNQCLPKVVTFLAYEEPLGMALASIAACLSLLTALVLWVFVRYKNTPIVRANNRDLSYILLISLFFCFLCSLLFIGRPSAANCLLRQTTFGVMFTVAVSSVLAKTITVLLAFRATRPGSRSRKWMGSRAPISVVLFCTLIQFLLCGVWLLLSPPFPEADTHSDHEHIILGCNEGSLIAFYFVLSYMGVLALMSFTVAFFVRNLPDTFNEAKFITFSMLVFCSVWITFLPTYQSTKGKMMAAVEIFSILSSSTGLLACIFIPKCYVILLQPHRNTKKSLKNNLHSFLKKILFNNSAGNQVVLDKKNSLANYDMLNYVTFGNDTEILVKVGELIFQAPLSQDFIMQEKAIVWHKGKGKVQSCKQQWSQESIMN
ncbi:vomeronasal type-2 receptor 26-like [Antechinus flavipes]|uniref:vomeronasal type-2 receptor 26-like n=1 Tax=Antechinus flavipes TaxID=38775 RepID=UPI0022369621|nr:vomeronasal type-2 receptor 26-like [Antechinus flavipes]